MEKVISRDGHKPGKKWFVLDDVLQGTVKDKA